MPSKTMPKSKIGYCGTGADGRPVDWYYGFNPGGYGCSGHCDGCWAERTCHRQKCPDCAAFRVHIHPERLCQPANTRKPGVVLCNFTNDWLDPERMPSEIETVGEAMHHRHVYVTLTKQVRRLGRIYFPHLPSIYHGLTIRTQMEAVEKLPQVGFTWVSLEPLQTDIIFAADELALVSGCIVGHDNRRGAPGTETLDHVRSVVRQCQDAGVACYVKQVFLPTCPKCKTTYEFEDGDRCLMTDCRGKLATRLHRDVEQFPEDLQLRNLPWSAPKETT